MRRPSRTALATLTSVAVAASIALAPVVHAQNDSPAPSPSPFCAILTEAEVSAAVKVKVKIDDSSDTDCDYGNVKNYTSIDVRVETGAVDDTLRAGFPGFTDVTVAGQPALLDPDGGVLFIQTDFGLLTLQLVGVVGKGAKAPKTLQTLGELAFPRLASIPFPVPSLAPIGTPAPIPSFGGAPGLEALFPTTIAGQPITATSLAGQQILAFVSDPAKIQLITAGLTAVGKTIDDLSLAFVPTGELIALQVQGLDAATIETGFLPFIQDNLDNPVQTPATVGGKSVIKITDGPDSPTASAVYVYAGGDVLWAVLGLQEPELTEIFTKLP